KLKVIGNGSSNGIDTKVFDQNLISEEEKETLRISLDIEKDDFVFIFVGRIVGDKGINELVQGFDRLTEEYKKIKLLLVGPLESELDPLKEQTLKRLDENQQIISTGFQVNVVPYFSIADVLVFPSYREGFPNVVMQAGAMGLPSIVSDINGCNEIIEDGQNGIIVSVKEVEELREKMEKIYSDKKLYSRLKENSRERIISRYDRQTVMQLIKNEYNYLLNEN
ncbi:MAG: glycosyltransferase, partial [Nitrososphaeraceae archaeon]|nr:glycosyltransferase [Nitrososphaeraceae archaeon]